MHAVNSVGKELIKLCRAQELERPLDGAGLSCRGVQVRGYAAVSVDVIRGRTHVRPIFLSLTAHLTNCAVREPTPPEAEMVQSANTAEELDVGALARQQLTLFGENADEVLPTRAENFRQHGQAKNTAFWRAVAEAVAVLSAPGRGG